MSSSFQLADFNPRSHERSDALLILCRQLWNISIHAPTRGATYHSLKPKNITGFQSTLPREERPSNCPCPSSLPIFQSTLPREERLKHQRLILTQDYISIHAPTRGATVINYLLNRRFGISIHAPTRGATDSRGSTEIYGVFQSTLPREERPKSTAYYAEDKKFQSTLPREERRY